MSYDTLDPSTLALIGVRVKAGGHVALLRFLEVDPTRLGAPIEVKEVTMEVRWNPDPLAAFDWRVSVENGVRCKLTRRGPRRRATWRPWNVMKILGARRNHEK